MVPGRLVLLRFSVSTKTICESRRVRADIVKFETETKKL